MISKRKEFLTALKNPYLADLQKRIKQLRKKIKLLNWTVSSRYFATKQYMHLTFSYVEQHNQLIQNINRNLVDKELAEIFPESLRLKMVYIFYDPKKFKLVIDV